MRGLHILLMDERFAQNNINISKWIENCKRLYNNFSDLEADLGAFFKMNGVEQKEEIKVDKSGYK